MEEQYDFSGWATKFNIRCSDGRTIRQGAFDSNHSQTVPLVWNHQHNDAKNILGHALLEKRPEGVYAYCKFNNTPDAQHAKEMVRNRDIRALSIYATHLKQNGSDVMHGSIAEVSLVLKGANAGAFIDNVLAHSDEFNEEDYAAEIYHSYDTPSGLNDLVILTGSESENSEEKPVEHAEKEDKPMEENKVENQDETVEDVFNTLTEKQKKVVYYMLAQAAGEAIEDEAKHSDIESMEDEEEMKHNVFEQGIESSATLSHAEIQSIVASAKKNGSLRDAWNDFKDAHKEDASLAHSITNVENLFPDAQAVAKPETIARETSWVGKVMKDVHHTPFSRVKSTAFNITEKEARAKGYIKGKQKLEEVITSLKRVTTPQTVYKLQKMDRDDIIDITDFDVVAYLKVEMRNMLEEELARAFLIGDGRLSSADDKINPLNIRPVLGDDAVYTTEVTVDENGTPADWIDAIIANRKKWKGTGSPSLYMTEDKLTSMLLIKDSIGHYMYKNAGELATVLRVKEIVPVEVMEEEEYEDVLGIMVNMNDYNVGADKGGQVTLFDDFDINFNKYEYLIETRCSGALVKPYAAVAFKLGEVA